MIWSFVFLKKKMVKIEDSYFRNWLVDLVSMIHGMTFAWVTNLGVRNSRKKFSPKQLEAMYLLDYIVGARAKRCGVDISISIYFAAQGHWLSATTQVQRKNKKFGWDSVLSSLKLLLFFQFLPPSFQKFLPPCLLMFCKIHPSSCILQLLHPDHVYSFLHVYWFYNIWSPLLFIPFLGY